MSLMGFLLCAVFVLMLVGFYKGAWPFDGQPGQYVGMVFVSASLVLLLALNVVGRV